MTISRLEEAWPADSVERRPLDSLIPYASNARTHSDEQVAQIAASMREWGWTNPVLIDGAGGIIAGHGRVLAASKLGFTDAPCMVAVGWTKAQKQAYVLADNQLAQNAGKVGAGRFLICFFEVHNRQNRHARNRPFALFPSADRSLVRAGMVADAKGN